MREKAVEIVIASGKGGVGKSLIASTIATALRKDFRIIVGDCDADTPNQKIYFSKYIYDEEKRGIKASEKAKVNAEKCINCKKCAVCPYGAISFNGHAIIKEVLCEGCGLCKIVCPTKAITLEEVENAEMIKYETELGIKVISAQLKPGSSGSGKIVDEVKKACKSEAGMRKADLIIYDSAAGIGCPVISSIKNTDYAILVVEPTPSSINDMKRVNEVIKQFGIKTGCIINNCDYNAEMKQEIKKYCTDEGIELLDEIPHDKRFIKAITELEPAIIYDKTLEKYFRKSIGKVKELLNS